MDLTAEERRLRDARTNPEWRLWGPYLSERQWGTVREDYSEGGDAWDYFTHDAAALAGLPLGRGRAGRAVRRPAADVLRHRPVERAGRHREGAAVRPHQLRGQPRRGREGVLLLPGQRAHALLPALAVQVPAAGVPVRGPGADEPLPVPSGAGVRAARHGRVRRGSVLRRPGRVREGRSLGPGLPHHGRQPGPGRRAAPPAAHAVVPQHLVLAAEQRAPPPEPGRRRPPDGARGARGARRVHPPRRGPGRPPLLREREQLRAAVGHARARRPTRRTGSTTTS